MIYTNNMSLNVRVAAVPNIENSKIRSMLCEIMCGIINHYCWFESLGFHRARLSANLIDKERSDAIYISWKNGIVLIRFLQY